MNHRVLLRSSRHPSSVTTALPSQPRQLLKSSVSQTLVHRLLHSPGSGVETSPSARFQNSFLFASAGRSGGKTGKRGFSSTARKRTGEKKDVEGGGDKGGDGNTGGKIKGGDGSTSGKIKVPEPEEKEVKSITPEKPYTRPEKESLPYSKTTPSPPISNAKIKGKLIPTPFRRLKLLLPLTGLANSPTSNNGYLVLLAHPQQTLSILAQLIQTELPPLSSDPTRAPRVTFKAPKHTTERGIEGGFVRWSSSTEIGDFVRDAARIKEFTIEIEDTDDVVVSVPSFKERCYFLREKLWETKREIDVVVKLREECDAVVQRRLRRPVVGGLFGIVGWWAGVYWLTFGTAYGWDLITPIAYLVGLSTVISSYLFFLYSIRNFSQQSAMLSRQQRLYESRGSDQDRLRELVDAGKTLRKEILAIADQYDENWDEGRDEVGGEEVERPLKGNTTG